MARKRKKIGKPGKKAPTGNEIYKYILLSAVILSFGMIWLVQQKPAEKYSQLSLIQQTLPQEVEAGTLFTFGFEILNREGKGMLYDYKVLLDGKEIGGKRAVLEKGERKRFFEGVKLEAAGEHRIDVSMKTPDGKEYDVFFKLKAV